jgi:CDP-diacylglycerol--glycerol-3-phosphate 3-phosphatidyltransferase
MFRTSGQILEAAVVPLVLLVVEGAPLVAGLMRYGAASLTSRRWRMSPRHCVVFRGSAAAPAGGLAPMNGLYAIKPWYTRRLQRIVDVAVARRISPVRVHGRRVWAAAGCRRRVRRAGVVDRGAGALAARLAGANLDGAVARARGVARPWGLRDSTRSATGVVPDRLRRVRVARGGYGRPSHWCGRGGRAATLPTFASLLAAGAGATRATAGPVGSKRALRAGRPWRRHGPRVARFVCGVVVGVGSLATAVVRLVAVAHRSMPDVLRPHGRIDLDWARSPAPRAVRCSSIWVTLALLAISGIAVLCPGSAS